MISTGVPKPIYTIDTETDPFKYGRIPVAFATGFFDGKKYTDFWGRNCIDDMFDHLQEVPPGIIYAHNGGRFDVLGYFLKWIVGHPMRVINNRIVKCHVPCKGGFHELRDSYSIMPFRLADYKGKTQKREIDITKMECENREIYKSEIRLYLKYDCLSLHELVSEFVDRYGFELTVGTTAMKQLKTFHSFDILESKADVEMRALYFYGGRVDCLRSGIVKGNFKLYDVNSMYPHVMANYSHPIGAQRIVGKRITRQTCFITATGRNYRAFPVRSEDGGLDYTVKYGRFSVSRHEWDVAEELGLFKCDKVHMTFGFEEMGTFNDFVTTNYEARLEAKKNDDEIEALFLKFILNSAYGKFAQSPDNYKEYAITLRGQEPDATGTWKPATIIRMGGTDIVAEDSQYVIWIKPSFNATRFNVATGASITGAARSVLLRAIATAKNPIYCDTDSLLCEDLQADKDPKKLGAWKTEAEVDMAAIAGKKLYAFYKDGICIKKAHKGFKITGDDIVEVCKGETVMSYNDAPTFKLDGKANFIHRKVRMTV